MSKHAGILLLFLGLALVCFLAYPDSPYAGVAIRSVQQLWNLLLTPH
jgi:hypothetical protein